MAQPPLETLRREIDEIDDAIQDLLIRRTEFLTQLGRMKGAGVAMRPGREAQVLRRLAGRHHGPFPRTVLLRMWREIFGAFNRLQGPFRIGVHMPEAGAGYLDLARDQYGSYTDAHAYRSYGQVLRAVSQGEVTVGVLSMPQEDDEDPWWRSLMTDDDSSPRIVARLPFARTRDEFGNKLEALAVAKTILESSGVERSYVAFEATGEMSRTSMRAAFRAAGFEPVFIATWREHPDLPPRLFLAEVAGFVAGSDPRLERFREASDETILRICPLGGYPMPFSDGELADEEQLKPQGTGK